MTEVADGSKKQYKATDRLTEVVKVDGVCDRTNRGTNRG